MAIKKSNLFISKGNMKVHAAIFNLPCRKTCKSGLECHKFCYAAKAERLYPNVKPCREKNLKESKLNSFVPRIVEMILKSKQEFFRIHESGDFYNVLYILKWFEVCRLLPQVKFYTYTKRTDLFDHVILSNKPDNLTLSLSLDGIKEGNIGQLTVPNGYDNLAITHKDQSTCPAQLNDNIKCVKDCKICLQKNKNVIVFKKH
jgi:hypothetical protein